MVPWIATRSRIKVLRLLSCGSGDNSAFACVCVCLAEGIAKGVTYPASMIHDWIASQDVRVLLCGMTVLGAGIAFGK